MFDDADEEAVIAHRKFMKLVVVFENETEKVAFEHYIKEEISRVLLEQEKFIEKRSLEQYNDITEEEKSKFNIDIQTGILLVNEMEELRNLRRR